MSEGEGYYNWEEREAMDGYRADYYGKPGCCLTCSKTHKGCLCFDCRCTHCIYYERSIFRANGECRYPQKRFTGLRRKGIPEEYRKKVTLVTPASEWILREIMMSSRPLSWEGFQDILLREGWSGMLYGLSSWFENYKKNNKERKNGRDLFS